LPRNCGVIDLRLENWKSALRFGTWNVRTLYQPGEALTLVKEAERFKLGILALQEIRWNEGTSMDMGNTTIFYGQCDNRRQGGSGFAVQNNLIHAIKDFKVINSRLTVLILETKWFKVAFVNAHAPTEEKNDDEKEEFYSLLETSLEDIPRGYIVILLGDFNAKIGKEECFRPIIGVHSLHQISNNNGCRLVDLATGKGLKIKSTMFPHKEVHKGTWRSPDGRYVNQIDHILVNSRFSNCILDVRTFRGADCGSDHFLVVGKLKVTLKKIENRKENHSGLYDISKLRELKVRETLQSNIASEIKRNQQNLYNRE